MSSLFQGKGISLSGSKILIVDDQEDNIELLSYALAREGYFLLTVVDGQMSVQIAEESLPDLILLDILMPGISGLDVCLKLKQNQKTKDIPVIFVTAKRSPTEMVEGFDAGAVDYLIKPINFTELCVRVKIHLQIRTYQKILQQNEERLQAILDHVVDGIVTLDSLGNVDSLNPAIQHLFGYQPRELIGQPVAMLLKETKSLAVRQLLDVIEGDFVLQRPNTFMVWCKKKSGTHFPVDFSFSQIRQGAKGFICVLHDITSHQEAQQKLLALSQVDHLTGIPNRRMFEDYYLAEWKRAARNRTYMTVFLVDIDKFKDFNDEYGHQMGDGCIREIARTIFSELKRPADLVARYGGEEFVVVLPETDLSGAKVIAEELRECIEKLEIPASLNSDYEFVTISIGTATLVPAQEMDSKWLVNEADKALYKAKNAGRNRVEPVDLSAFESKEPREPRDG